MTLDRVSHLLCLWKESLKLRHYDLSHSWLLAQDIVEKTCLVVRDAKQTQIPPKPVTYVLPDDKCMSGYVAETENEDAWHGGIWFWEKAPHLGCVHFLPFLPDQKDNLTFKWWMKSTKNIKQPSAGG